MNMLDLINISYKNQGIVTVFEIEKEERRTRRMLSIRLNYLSKGQVPSQPVVRHVLLQKFKLHSGVVIKAMCSQGDGMHVREEWLASTVQSTSVLPLC